MFQSGGINGRHCFLELLLSARHFLGKPICRVPNFVGRLSRGWPGRVTDHWSKSNVKSRLTSHYKSWRDINLPLKFSFIQPQRKNAFILYIDNNTSSLKHVGRDWGGFDLAPVAFISFMALVQKWLEKKGTGKNRKFDRYILDETNQYKSRLLLVSSN